MSAFRWSSDEVAAALSTDPPAPVVEFTGVSTDTRSLKGGELFVALVGERFDAHEFLTEAVAAGACGVVVQKGPVAPLPASIPVFLVDDTLVALGRLAAHRRAALAARVVGITGSVGKTTTKNLTRGALGGAMRTHATSGNFNNRVGLPLTVLEAPQDTDVLVLEMGTNEPGEIAALTEIASPDVGVVTTVGEVHLEKLGSLDGVFHEKLALIRGLREGGVAVVGDDPPELADRAREDVPAGARLHVAGTGDNADQEFRGTLPVPTGDGRYAFQWLGRTVTLAIPGRAAIRSAVLALSVAEVLGIDVESATAGVSEVQPGSMRGEVRRFGQLRVLVDCYNASPQSVRAAGALLEEFDAPGGRVAVLGSMLELGDRSAALHRETLDTIRGMTLDRLYLTGAFAEASAGIDDARLRAVEDVDALSVVLPRELRGDEAVLLKGSRGVRLERLLPGLEARFGTPGAEA